MDMEDSTIRDYIENYIEINFLSNLSEYFNFI